MEVFVLLGIMKIMILFLKLDIDHINHHQNDHD